MNLIGKRFPCVLAMLLLASVSHAGGVFPKGGSLDGLTRVTAIEDVAAFYVARPAAIPLNGGRSLAWCEGLPASGFTGFESSKIYPTSRSGRYMLARTSNATFGMYDLTTFEFLGTVPLTAENPMTTSNNPRFGQDLQIIFTTGATVRRQTWNLPATAVTIATLPAGSFIGIGDDGDASDDGRFYPVKTATGYANGAFTGVSSGVCDIQAGRLSAMVPGNPDGIDVSPDGSALAWMDGEGAAAGEPNRLYSIPDLFVGVTRMVPLQSASVGGVKSIGHYGWARIGGRSVLVGQDNRVDFYRSFDLQTGAAANVLDMRIFGYPSPNVHFGRTGPDGKIFASTYASREPYPNNILMIELATGAITNLGRTHLAPIGKELEGAACVDRAGAFAYFGSNWDGRDNAEIFRIALPATPTPTPFPLYRIRGTIDGKPVDLSVTPGAQ